jgi:hypothetical protein
MLLAAGLILAACSSDDDPQTDGSSAADRTSSTLRLNLAAGDVPSLPEGADSLLIRGFNRSGWLVFGPSLIEIPGSGIPSFILPTSTTILDIAVLQDGATVATYAVRLADLAANQTSEVAGESIQLLTVAGETGPAGPEGDTGPSGAAGDTGPTGTAGDTGSTGFPGATGVDGPTGPQGETGADGATGADGTGPQGDAGVQGPQGDTGAQGPRGDAGAQGPQGAPGARGDAGPQGDTGPSGDAIATYIGSFHLATPGTEAVAGATEVPFSDNTTGQFISHSPGSTQFTVLNTGTYLITANLSYTSGAGASMAIAINGGTAEVSSQVELLPNIGEVSTQVIMVLTSGDIISVRNSSGIPFTMPFAPSVGASISILQLAAGH